MRFFNDVTKVNKTFKCSFYAYESKIDHKIMIMRDCIELQNDLDVLHYWCLENMGSINGITFKRVTEMRNPTVTFIENLCFNKDMDFGIAKAYSMLGFVKRNVKVLKSSMSGHILRMLLLFGPHTIKRMMIVSNLSKRHFEENCE